MGQSVEVQPDKGEMKCEDESDKDAVGHLFCSTFTASTLPRMPLKDLETSKEVEK